MFNWLRVIFDAQIRHASRLATAFVRSCDDRTPVAVSLRADEEDRWVFAVFYKEAMPHRPTPYSLVAVSKDSDKAERVGEEESEVYRLRNYK
jgi:hypothetical protein